MQAYVRGGYVRGTVLVRLVSFVLVPYCVGFVGAVVGQALG